LTSSESADERLNQKAVAAARALASRPFPYGFGLRELTSRFEVAALTMAIRKREGAGDAVSWRVEEECVLWPPPEGEEPRAVPEHDFVMGKTRIFFSAGVLAKVKLLLTSSHLFPPLLSHPRLTHGRSPS
jgi:hypothetical protein